MILNLSIMIKRRRAITGGCPCSVYVIFLFAMAFVRLSEVLCISHIA